MKDLFSTMMGSIGGVFILAALVTCVLACTFVVIDTIRDTTRTIRYMINEKNKKTKN